MPEAVIFDFDGTLCDSENVWLEVLRREYARLGLPFDTDGYLATIGLPSGSFDAFTALAVGTDETIGGVESRLEREVLNILLATGPSSAVRSIVQLSVDAELRLAIATNNRPEFVEDVLRGWGLKDYFEVIAGRIPGLPQKPDPGPYLRALAALDLPSAAALAVEDSCAGAQSAIAAGLRCFLLGTTVTCPNGAEAICSLADPILHAAFEGR